MNIKFKIERISKLEGNILIDRILAELMPLEYRIDKKDQLIKFDDEADFSSDFKLYSRYQMSKRMKYGNFEILDLNEDRIVKLTYFKSITIETCALAFFLIIAIVAKSPILLLFEFPLIIQFVIFADLSNGDSKQMLKRITTD